MVTADPTLVREAHAGGRQIIVWSVEAASSVRPLLDARVDGIITSRPDVVRAMLEGR
jgi:glycerophosphoryl diester phosphodiesterase